MAGNDDPILVMELMQAPTESTRDSRDGETEKRNRGTAAAEKARDGREGRRGADGRLCFLARRRAARESRDDEGARQP